MLTCFLKSKIDNLKSKIEFPGFVKVFIMRKLFLSLLIVVIAFSASAQIKSQVVNNQTKPWTRWWWMGSAVDEAGIKKQLTQLAAAGFGGVEIVPIYGAKGFENKYIKYLSPQWMADAGLYSAAGKDAKDGCVYFCRYRLANWWQQCNHTGCSEQINSSKIFIKS